MASIGSEWKKWDLHLHTASSYDYRYKTIMPMNFYVNHFVITM